MEICKECGAIVNNFGKHIRRNRCIKQHIRLGDNPGFNKKIGDARRRMRV